MKWTSRKSRRGTRHYANGKNIGYNILPKRNGKYYIKAYLVGGAEHRLPYQDFDTADEAKAWVVDYEAKLAERNARYAAEEPIKL